MPRPFARPCLGCWTLTTHRSGRCDTCRSRYEAQRRGQRPSRRARGQYDTQYQRNRATLLAGNPPCHWCRAKPATLADHLVPLSLGGSNEIDNLVPACASCNNKRAVR